MPEPDERLPRVQANKSAWRAGAVVLLLVVAALVAVIISQTALVSGRTDEKVEPLTTLALVLAILAFLIQIAVFVLQNNTATRTIQRTEELNNRGQRVLDEIRATSKATEDVISTQFDRLLDFVVGRETAPEPEEEDERDDQPEDTPGGLAPRTIPRPNFSLGLRPLPERDALMSIIRSYPSRMEAEAIVERLRLLSPMAMARLGRMSQLTVTRLLRGGPLGTKLKPNAPISPDTHELVDAGLLEREGDRFMPTLDGLAAFRVLPTPKEGDPPAWWADVTAPLRQPPAGA